MPNNRIKQKLENYFGKVMKVFNKKCSFGLVSGVRVLIMERKTINVHPIPSYVYVDGQELYLTYSGKNFTCKYCGEVEHKQADFENVKPIFHL